MTLFAVFATLLIIVAAAFLLPPLWLGLKPAVSAADRRAANLAIFRDQLAELEREKAEGTLAEADFEQAKRELQHRLLEEVQPEGQAAASDRPSRKTAVALLVLVPVLAVVGYTLLGNPRALNPALTAPRPEVTPAQIEGMVAKLAERLKANPDDMQGWIMLARSYKAMGRYAEAAQAYGKAESVVMQDAGLLADYAEALAMSSQSRMQGKPQQLIDQALKLDPQNSQVLLMAGVGAMQAGKRAEAAAYWEKLLPMVEEGSEMETMLKSSIEKLRSGK
ncbi:MAG TPA: c-type cytochrome biogenesis protein CcmI [Rhodocyclaceae bacterium]|nr:c-type cytochrome biogenesis protein CcmI [Rhodocyclaceae bacterium]